MLIKLTNRCTMMCEHCMEESTPDSNEFMSMDTFRRAVTFGQKIGCMAYVLSGGEPTENEQILEMCQWFDQRMRGINCLFTICSNGMWLKDEVKRERIRKITELPTFHGMQVYTHKRWYREYDYVVAHTEEYESYPGVKVDADDTIWMQDLGRARQSEAAQAEVSKNPYKMSCCNCTLAARQLKMQGFGMHLTMHGQLCKPAIDAEGGVHMSESRTCPTVGNVWKDSPAAIYERMQTYKPCGRCAGYKRFVESTEPQIVRARMVLGL